MKHPINASSSCPAGGAREQALDEVAAVYAELARRPIERDCRLRAECCHFRRTGLTPWLTKGEAIYLARAVRAAGKTRCPEPSDGACPVWDARSGRCGAYEGRPLGCRTHFCQAAGGPWDRAGVLDLIRRLEAIDARLAGDGPRPLPGALKEALADWPKKTDRKKRRSP